VSGPEKQSRANDKPDLDLTPLANGLLTHLRKFEKARAAGTEMIQPLFNFSLVEAYGKRRL